MLLEDCGFYRPNPWYLSSLGSTWIVICVECYLIGSEHHQFVRFFSSLCVSGLDFNVQTNPVLVATWFQIKYPISLSVLFAFASLKTFLERFLCLDCLLLQLFVQQFEQIGCLLDKCCYICTLWLLELCCDVQPSIVNACFCLYMQANECLISLCTL